MIPIQCDAVQSDDARRRALYDGTLCLTSPTTATKAFCEFASHMIEAVPNSSSTYNYYEWNQKYRRAASANITAETRPLPGPTHDVDLTDSITLVTPVGGLIQFSGQHLHSSVPNATGKTRYSIDFRTAHIGDIRAHVSARNVAANSSGSSIRDFIRASDFTALPDDVFAIFDDGTEARGELLYSDNENDPGDEMAPALG